MRRWRNVRVGRVIRDASSVTRCIARFPVVLSWRHSYSPARAPNDHSADARQGADAEDRYAAGAFCKLARLLTAARGDPISALALARAHRAKERIVGILKSAVTSGSLTDWSAISDYVNISRKS